MAEIQSPSNSPARKGTRSRKLSTRVDLTPMVDLGFLLITFFIFTTSMTEPKAMPLDLPADGDSTEAAEGKTINLVLAENDKVIYYYGRDMGNARCTNFSAAGVRKIIQDMQQKVLKAYGDKHQTVILIHPTDACSYKNLVDVLDEMLITDINKYVLMPSIYTKALASIAVKDPC